MTKHEHPRHKIAIMVISNPNSGKSSVIRALTGVGNVISRRGPLSSVPPVYRLYDRLGNIINALVIHTSPQERNVPPNQFLSKAPYKHIRTLPHDTLILGLEELRPWPATQYIDILIRLSYDVRVVLLSQNPASSILSYLQQNNIPYLHLPYDPNTRRGPPPLIDPFHAACVIRRSQNPPIWPP